MAILPILKFPDPKLKERSIQVVDLTLELSKFLKDLVTTMEFYPGCVGLAAPQVGCFRRVIAVDVSRYRHPVPGHGLQVLINPIVLEASGHQVFREGCLSVPEYTGNVSRAMELHVEALNLDGEKIFLKSTGFEAIVLQHEIDHLDGILFLDRVTSLKTDLFRRKVFLH